jgi:hypothetical protein
MRLPASSPMAVSASATTPPNGDNPFPRLSLIPTQRVTIVSSSEAKPAKEGQPGGFVVLALRNYQ